MLKESVDWEELGELQQRWQRLKRLQQLREVETRKKKEFGLPFYRPHWHQHLFHRNGDKMRRLAEAGNRSGKSEAGIVEDVAWLLGERSWYKHSFDIKTRNPETGEIYVVERHEGHEFHPFVRIGIPKPPNKILVLVENNDIIAEVFTGKAGKIWDYLPQGCVAKKIHGGGGVVTGLELVNDSVIQFDTISSFKLNPQSHESKDWDAIHMDEPCPQPMYNANARGLADRNGKAWFTLTPLREPWIGDTFFGDKNNAKDRPKEHVGDLVDDKGEIVAKNHTFAIRWTMDENSYNSKEGIDAYLATLDEDEREARRFGIPLAFAGMVYRDFDKGGKHILQELPKGWKAYNDPPKDYSIFVTIDPHQKTDFHALFMAVDPLGNYYLYDELKTINDTRSFANAIKPKLLGRKVGWIKCDPTAWREDPVNHTSIARDFMRHGINVVKAAQDLQTGIPKVKEVLRWDKGFYVSPWLGGFRREIRNYMWDKSGKKPIDRDDHFMECFYRMLYALPKWFPKVVREEVEESYREDAGDYVELFDRREDYSLWD